MSVKELLKSYPAGVVEDAAARIKTMKEISERLAGSPWAGIPLIFEGTHFILPAFEGYRPLSITLHNYGLWVQPLDTPPSEKAKQAYSLHINESKAGLRIYVEDAFCITLKGNYEDGFILEKTEMKENTVILAPLPD